MMNYDFVTILRSEAIMLPSWLEHGPGLKMYFLLNIGIFQRAMLVYQRGSTTKKEFT